MIFLPTNESDDDVPDPLGAGSASMPRTQGEGCLSRFSPETLNEDMGADFSSVDIGLAAASDPD
ncbi:MAG: hypothetical protein ACKVK5_02350 [Pseudomonadales bacterium]|jgi:hypothetical protein